MRPYFFPALRLTLLCVIAFAGLYTALMLGIARLTPNKGHADMVTADGRAMYANIAQAFTEDRYFQPRPSAVGYNAAGSAGSNKGPSNAGHLLQVEARIDTFLVHNPGVQRAQVPVELVTASGSGLDPDLSPAAARVQFQRIANSRGLSLSALEDLLTAHLHPPLLGLFGPPKVNVLELNIALDHSGQNPSTK